MQTFFKPIRWNTLPRDFAVIQIGFALFGLAIALLIQANLGTNPWVMLTVAIADLTSLSEGTITILTGVSVLGAALLMKEPIGWGTLGNILFIGPWLDLFLWLMPPVTGNWLLQGMMLLLGILMLGFATGLYISVNAGAGPRDSLMLAVERTTRLNLRQARGGIELAVFVVALLMDGPFGIGTVAIAILIGPAVQWGFKLFDIQR